MARPDGVPVEYDAASLQNIFSSTKVREDDLHHPLAPPYSRHTLY
jgi:hypothetical protein